MLRQSIVLRPTGMPFLPSVLFFTPFLTWESFELRMLVTKYLFPILKSGEFSHSFFFWWQQPPCLVSFIPTLFSLAWKKFRLWSLRECICTFIIWQMLRVEINFFFSKKNLNYIEIKIT